MFGFKLIKIREIENLKLDLAEAKLQIEEQEDYISELLNKIKHQDTIIANLTSVAKTTNDNVEEKPVKKVRRKNSKKTVKKED